MVRLRMVTPSALVLIQRARVVTSTVWPLGLSPRRTRRSVVLTSANWPEAGCVPGATGSSAWPSKKTCSGHKQRLFVPASQALGSALTSGRGGTACWLSHVAPCWFQAVHTSEPRISLPAWPARVSGLLMVTVSRAIHGGAVTVAPDAAASTNDCSVFVHD